MTKEFDPTRPYKYRNGEKPQVIFVLFNPTEYGKTIVSVHKDRGSITHFPDGKISKYWTCGADLINITEEVDTACRHNSITSPTQIKCEETFA